MDTDLVQQIEMLFGSIGVILGLFFSIFLLGTRKEQPLWNLFLGIYLLTFGLRIGKSVFHYFYEIDGAIRNFFLAILFCVGPSIWLHTKYRVLQKKEWDTKDGIHYLPVALLLPVCWFIPNEGPENPSALFPIFYNSIIVHMMVYCIMGSMWFLRKKSDESIILDKTSAKWLTYFLGINLVFVVCYALISHVFLPFYIGLSFLFSFLVVFLSLWALKNPKLFKKPIEKYSLSNMDERRAEKIMDRVKEYFKETKPYLNPELSLASLSTEMGVSTKDLSQAINQREKLNYSQFVLDYRIEEAKRLLLSDSHKHMTIAAIAYDSGFNSISSFNSAFKRTVKITPLAFQKRSQKSS